MQAAGWRGLAVFWAAILLVLAAGGVTLQVLGPVRPPMTAAGRPAAAPGAAGGETPATAQSQAVPPAAPAPAAGTTASAAAPLPPGRATPGPIADPDPALLEPANAGGGAMLPRKDATGRGPMQAYARGFDRTTLRPRIGLIMAGIGMNQADSEDAIRTLPGGVTLAVSPYAPRLTRQLEAARIAGHEYLLSLPMEPQGYPLNDAGNHALMTGADPARNATQLDWALSRFNGYAGVTNALGALRGERFAGAADLMAPILQALTARGLFYVDARPGAAPMPGVWEAEVDLVIDEPAVRSEIDAKLARLEALARERGYALGLAGTPRPVTVERIAAWANGLPAKGLALAPASALARFAPETSQAKPGQSGAAAPGAAMAGAGK